MIFKIFSKRKEAKYKKIGQQILKNSNGLENLSSSELRDLLNSSNMVTVFSALVVLSERSVGLKPYLVQIMASLACCDGYVIDMKTGEGKTLVAALSAIVLYKKGYIVNIATSNSYLSDRDYQTMNPLYVISGVSAGRLSKKTNEKLIPFDVYYQNIINDGCLSWLSDHVVENVENLTHPHLLPSSSVKTAIIIDEIDQSLIESSSVNYSIVSNKQQNFFSQQIAELCKILPKSSSYVDLSGGSFKFTESFYNAVEKLAIEAKVISDPSELYTDLFEFLTHMKTAYTAFYLLKESEDYTIKKSEIYRIDKRSGRLLEGGFLGVLMSYLSYKHGLKIPSSSVNIISSALQNYVKSFDLLIGMSGTANLNALELRHSYNVPTIKIPQNKITQRVDYGHMLFKNDDLMNLNVAKFLCKASREQRPTLLVCESETQAELIAGLLTQKAVNASLLISSNIDDEVDLISKAGRYGSIVITTRLCGRGSDIVCEDIDRGLLIIVLGIGQTENDDQQVIGRTGRQGAHGESYFCVSLDNKVFNTQGSGIGRSILSNLVQHDLEGMDIGMSKAVTKVVKKIQRRGLSVARESRKRVAIYNKPISSQLSLLQKKRELILYSSDPKSLLLSFLPEITKKQKDLIDYYEYVIGDDSDFLPMLRQGMLMGLTEAWSEHFANLENIKLDLTTNTKESANINNYKKNCLTAFSSFSETVNDNIFIKTIELLKLEAHKKTKIPHIYDEYYRKGDI